MADHEMNEVTFAEPPVPPGAEQDHEMSEVNQTPSVEATQRVEETTQTIEETPPAQAAPTQPPQEVQEEQMVTEEHPIRHIQPPSHKETATRLLQQAGLQTLLWLQFLWVLLSRLTAATQSVSVGVLRSFQEKVYVFFQGSSHPYRLQDYVVAGPGVPPIEWYYDADKKLFLSSNVYNTTSEVVPHHFEWLSGEIKYNNLLLHDISEYLQQAKWAGAARPSPAIILSAWSLHSGIVLHLSQGIQLHTINQDATESVLTIRG